MWQIFLALAAFHFYAFIAAGVFDKQLQRRGLNEMHLQGCLLSLTIVSLVCTIAALATTAEDYTYEENRPCASAQVDTALCPPPAEDRRAVPG